VGQRRKQKYLSTRRNEAYTHNILYMYGYMFSYPDDEKVEQPIDIGPLEFRFSRILHKFRVSTGENHHPVTPFRVS